jgi:CRISPR-associated protein (TIGR03984 family)
MNSLFVHAVRGSSLRNALHACRGILGQGQATAILYSPRRCQLALLKDGVLVNSEGNEIEPSDIFEARVFCETAELRWLNDASPQKQHSSVLLSETKHSMPGWSCEEHEHFLAILPQTYLLWGEGTGANANDWNDLATPRIGRLPVPVTGVGMNQRVLLHSKEYVTSRDEDDGNAVVFEERLVGITVA